MGYVSTCRLLNSHSTEYIASGICVHLQIINIAIQLNTLQVGYVSTCRLLYGSGLIGWWTIIPLTYIAIQLNTLEVGYVSICRLLNEPFIEYIASGICVPCRLLYGSGLIGWWTIIPLTYYSHSTEYIASGICVHLQIINIAIH